MVVRLGDLALAGVHDPRQIVAPVVEAVLSARATARGERDFATSDLLRDVLTGAGVTVNDTPDGVGWSLADDERPDAATP
jgi:cysteinyl-tRNA synthetase